ncbi:hypothetical protein DFQ03_0174 [Maribacter caenipelagi]|uniref:Uncharacterized protein n=1 Tax=Maribacter caenipelagi TaxID=1447781 RepID=A0A4R7DJA2_9FLAO|nr:hypothetical protein DFQ03_0174 [Maribacter caenipelagi]
MVVGIWIWEITQFDEFLKSFYNWNERLEIPNILYGLAFSNVFTAAIASSILGIGLFLKNKTGWILITGWYWFLITNGIKSIFEEGIKDSTDFFQALFFFLIPLGLIFLMNKFNGISEYHKIQSSKKLKLNLLAIGIGILLAVFRVVKKNLLQQCL